VDKIIWRIAIAANSRELGSGWATDIDKAFDCAVEASARENAPLHAKRCKPIS